MASSNRTNQDSDVLSFEDDGTAQRLVGQELPDATLPHPATEDQSDQMRARAFMIQHFTNARRSVAVEKDRRPVVLTTAQGTHITGPQSPRTVGFAEVLTESWGDWDHQKGARLGAPGEFVVTHSSGSPGVEKRDVGVPPNALLRFTVTGTFRTINQKSYLVAFDPDNDLVLTPTHYIPASAINACHEVLFRTLSRTRRLHLRVLVERPKAGDTCRLLQAELQQLRPQRRFAGEPVIASLASVRGREAMLEDAVASLLDQVDVLQVYLNNYAETPAFLRDPRIEVVRSDAYGDLGDAGKFFWAGATDEPGYRLICDDDQIFPPDYCEHMLRKVRALGNQAIVGVHGILLKQPVANYYGSNARHVCNYHHPSAADYPVHVLGTGAVAYHSSTVRLARRDFGHPNMADIWLAVQAQKQDVPLICVARPHNWIIQNKLATHVPTIYGESNTKTASAYDTAVVQSQTMRAHWPLTIRQPTGVPKRRKLVMAFLTWNRVDYLKRAVETWLQTRSSDHDWIVIIADDGSSDGTAGYLDQLLLPHEVHIVGNQGRYACGQTNTVFELAMKIGFDVGFKADDDIYFTRSGWDQLYLDAIENSGFDHLCHLNEQHYTRLRRREKPEFELPQPTFDHSQSCSAHIGVEDCDGCLFTFTPKMIERVGYCDEENFPIRGQWHIDYSARACREGFNRADTFFDAQGSNDFIGLQANGDEYRCSLPWGDEYEETKQPEVLQRRTAIIRDRSRCHVVAPPPRWPRRDRSALTVNAIFDKVFVINLERRPDRLRRVVEQADRLSIDIERFEAVDGMAIPVRDAWGRYKTSSLVEPPAGVRPVENSRHFYLDYDSDVARVAYREQIINRKAITSAGAWGYLQTMIALLERAIEDDLETFLVLDDDAIFHRNFNRLFATTIGKVPGEWRVIQLGALQYHWERDWIEWHTDDLYRCRGSSIGSHAVGYHRDCIPMLLHRCRLFDLAYDIGALHTVKKAFSESCFTFYPNLVIQDTSESDINTSDVQVDEGSKPSNVYRWQLADYMMRPAGPVTTTNSDEDWAEARTGT